MVLGQAELQAIHGDLVTRITACRGNENLVCRFDDNFPAPPIPVPRHTQTGIHIEPIRTPKDLLDEGREQQNCVFGYADEILSGHVYVYRLLHPERATVSIIPGNEGGWVIEQCLLAQNRPVKRMTLLEVGAYLSKRQEIAMRDHDPILNEDAMNGHGVQQVPLRRGVLPRGARPVTTRADRFDW
jgi:hypothetical protein